MAKKYNLFLNSFFIFFFTLTLFGCYFFYHVTTFVKRGIDLVGGSYVSLAVSMEPVYQNLMIETKKRLKEELTDNLSPIAVEVNKDTLRITAKNDKELGSIEQKIKSLKLGLEIEKQENILILSLCEATKEEMKKTAIEADIKTLCKRLDPFGAGELLIARQGERIILEIPSIYDSSHVKNMIGKMAHLEMKRVIDSDPSKDKLTKKYKTLKDEVMIIPGKEKYEGWFVVTKESLITGSLLKKTYVSYSQQQGNKPVVTIEFNSVGAKKLYEATEKNINKSIAIIIDNEVITAPRVSSAIPQGIASIEGRFSLSEAQELVTLLETGSFAAPLTYLEERVIAPVLGEKIVKQGLFACLIGIILLFLFSIAYYRTSGFFAFLILLYNLLLTLIGMSLIDAALTLSGLAGLVLTLGMAIDSSILIFEKIKEELSRGQSFEESFKTAFSKGISVILDANITHFLVSLILYYIGAGPLKGFAITMLIGILSTLFTGIFLLKSLIKWVLRNKENKRISI
jgi:preprotein translocase subunit SecD